MILGELDVQHRLVDSLVPHPSHQRPRIDAEECSVRAEGVAEQMPLAWPLRYARALVDALDRLGVLSVRLRRAVEFRITCRS